MQTAQQPYIKTFLIQVQSQQNKRKKSMQSLAKSKSLAPVYLFVPFFILGFLFFLNKRNTDAGFIVLFGGGLAWFVGKLLDIRHKLKAMRHRDENISVLGATGLSGTQLFTLLRQATLSSECIEQVLVPLHRVANNLQSFPDALQALEHWFNKAFEGLMALEPAARENWIRNVMAFLLQLEQDFAPLSSSQQRGQFMSGLLSYFKDS